MTHATLTTAMAALHSPRWLYEIRRAALTRFFDAGLPDRHDEDWRYTSLDHLDGLALHEPKQDRESAVVLEDYPGALIAFLDDLLVWQDASLPHGMIGSLHQAMKKSLLREHLGGLAGDTALAQLNSALWRDGACLHVPARERLRQPVFLRHGSAEAEAMLHPRLLVVMETGSDAILIEHFAAATDAPYWRNPVAEIELAAGACLTHIRLTEEGAGATHTALTAVHLEADSNYRCLDLSLDGKLIRHDLRVDLAGDGANARMDGLFVVGGRRHADHHLVAKHSAPNTVSRMTWRGLAGGRARGIFNGLVQVEPGASKSDARQSSRNLLLSPHAEIDARPQLEIRTDDVRCAHGATVGRLDAEALFYLRSRGIDLDAARALLLTAFAGEALGLIDDAGLSGWLMPRILRRLAIKEGTMK